MNTVIETIDRNSVDAKFYRRALQMPAMNRAIRALWAEFSDEIEPCAWGDQMDEFGQMLAVHASDIARESTGVPA